MKEGKCVKSILPGKVVWILREVLVKLLVVEIVIRYQSKLLLEDLVNQNLNPTSRKTDFLYHLKTFNRNFFCRISDEEITSLEEGMGSLMKSCLLNEQTRKDRMRRMSLGPTLQSSGLVKPQPRRYSVQETLLSNVGRTPPRSLFNRGGTGNHYN